MIHPPPVKLYPEGVLLLLPFIFIFILIFTNLYQLFPTDHWYGSRPLARFGKVADQWYGPISFAEQKIYYFYGA
jgi:hypothetical protein